MIAEWLVLPLVAQEARWKILTDQVDKLYREGKYAEGIPVAQEALSVAEASFGVHHPAIGASSNNLAELYRAQGKYTEAEPLYRRALDIAERTAAPEPAVANILNNLGLLYDNQGKYSQAEQFYQRALAIREKALGPEHPDVAGSLNDLGGLYRDQGKYAEAEVLFKRSLAIREKALGPEYPDVAGSLDSLATLYRVEGKYVGAEQLFQRSIAIREKVLGREHPRFAEALANLADLYRAQGNYVLAEPLYRQALGVLEKALGPEHPDLAVALNNFAELYRAMGDYASAEPLYHRALDMKEKVLGSEHPAVAHSLTALARLYLAQGNSGIAEPLFQRALVILKKSLGPDHHDVATLLDAMAGLYENQGRYAAAEPLYQRSLEISERVFGLEHAYVGTTLNNLAKLYQVQGNYAAAEPLYQRALRILEKTLGREHPDVGASLENLASLYFAREMSAQAEPLFERRLNNLSNQFEQYFSYMSEKERLLFVERESATFPLYFSFCLTYGHRNSILIGKMYDVLLWQKGLVVRSIASVRTEIEASGDREALALFGKLTEAKTQLATLLIAKPADSTEWRKIIAQSEQGANEIEKELVKRSTTLAAGKKLSHVTWRDVQKALRQGEAAVEFVRFPFHNGKRWTGTTYYAALIVTGESASTPALVLLGEADKLERAPLVGYRELVDRRGAAGSAVTSFEEAFWKPLETALARTKRIYLSPDGVLSQISWGIVPAGNGQILMEKYDLHVVSSTKDILREKRAASADSAVLIGNPKFGLEEAEQRAVARAFQKTEETKPLLASLGNGLRSREQRGAALSPLPGTKLEVESVNSLLKNRRWRVEVYTEEQALKEAVKRAKNPRILHIATHGFFLPDQKEVRRNISGDTPSGREDPMLRSGLYFAGANRVLSGAAPAPDLDDGVLTAYEAMELNLQGTELVVLSACETGLGQVKNGEGVFGLRRALQIAGAEAVLMSLWSVPDLETQELMTLFYEKWLSGKDKYEALRESQLELRAKVKERYGQDLPFYWGAFVLVGR